MFEDGIYELDIWLILAYSQLQTSLGFLSNFIRAQDKLVADIFYFTPWPL